MKLFVGVLLSVFVVIHGAAIDSSEDSPITPFIVAPTALFQSAWTYQALLQTLQVTIDAELTEIRTSVSVALKSSSSETLKQIESNVNSITAADEIVRSKIFTMKDSICVYNLRVLLNGISEFSGFNSANCVTTYDKSVQEALNTAYALLQKYEGSFGDVQQIVVKSFSGKNAFLQADEIEAAFKKAYATRQEEWEAIRPDVESFLSTLQGNLASLNTVLGSCFKTIQDGVAVGYAAVTAEIATCEIFDNTADPFAQYRQ